MIAFLVYLSVMGNAAAVAALALWLDPKLTFLPWKILFFIGEVPLMLGICIIVPVCQEAVADYRRKKLERDRKRMSKDPAGIALRARLEEEGRRKFEEAERKKQLLHERIKAELERDRKDDEEYRKAFREAINAWFAERGAFPDYYDENERDEFDATVASRRARNREQTANG